MGRTPAPPRLRKRANGKWYIVYWDFEEGARKWRSCESGGAYDVDTRRELLQTFRDKSALSAARAISGPTGTAYRTNMREAVTRFLHDAADRRDKGMLKPKSLLRLQDVLVPFRESLPETMTTGELTARDIEQFIRGVAAEYPAATVNVNKQNVTTCLNWLAQERPRLFPEPEAFSGALRKKRLQRKPALGYTPEQLRAFHDALPGELQRVFMLMALTAGRRGEILNLRWSDVNLDTGVITLRATKTGRERWVPLLKVGAFPPVAPGLLKQMRTWEKGEGVCGPGGKRNEYWWLKASRAAGITIKPQRLRRNFAAFALASGVPADVLTQWMGHGLGVLADWYAHQVFPHKRASSIQSAMGL